MSSQGRITREARKSEGEGGRVIKDEEEEGCDVATNQGVRTSRSWRRHGNGFSPTASKRTPATEHTSSLAL